MARTVFKRDVRRIHLSDLDEGLEEHRLGVEEGSCVNGVSVIITSADISWRKDFVTRQDFMNFMVRCR